MSVSGVNGVVLNGQVLPKGAYADLASGDIFAICQRRFRWTSAGVVPIHVDSPTQDQNTTTITDLCQYQTSPSHPSTLHASPGLSTFSQAIHSNEYPGANQDLISWDEVEVAQNAEDDAPADGAHPWPKSVESIKMSKTPHRSERVSAVGNSSVQLTLD